MLLEAIQALPLHKLTLLSADEMLLPQYVFFFNGKIELFNAEAILVAEP